jgi:hypothetical protein
MGLIVSFNHLRARNRTTTDVASQAPDEHRERGAPSDLPYGHDTRTASSKDTADHSKLSVVIPLAATLAVFIVQTVATLLVSLPAKLLKGTVLFSLAACGVSVSVGSAGIVATAGMYSIPDFALNPYLSGQSLGGVVVSLGNFAASYLDDASDYCLAGGDRSQSNHSSDSAHSGACAVYQKIDWPVFNYFLAGSLIMFLCMIGYHYVHHESIGRRPHYEFVAGDVMIAPVDRTDNEQMSPRWGLEMHDTQQPPAEFRQSDDGLGRERSLSDFDMARSTIHVPGDGNRCSDASVFLDDERQVARMSSIGSDRDSFVFHDDERQVARMSSIGSDRDSFVVWRYIKGPATCIFLTFFVTLSLFPTWTSELASARRCKAGFRIYNDLFTPFTFVLFNVGDFVGRLMVPYLPLQKSPSLSKGLVALSLLRFVSFPLLFLCVRSGSLQDRRIEVRSDIYSVAVQFLLATTNGLLVSSSFVLAPSLLPHEGMQDRMSEILQLALSLGLLAGSFFSFFVVKLGP